MGSPNNRAIANASGRLGSYLPVSMLLMVCRDTFRRSASSACDQPCSDRSRRRQFSTSVTEPAAHASSVLQSDALLKLVRLPDHAHQRDQESEQRQPGSQNERLAHDTWQCGLDSDDQCAGGLENMGSESSEGRRAV